MPADWYVHRHPQGETLGPLAWDDLTALFVTGGMPDDALVSGPGVPWTRARDVEAVARVLCEHDERHGWRVKQGWHVPLPPIPHPGPGEAWFFKTPPLWVALLWLATLGLYWPVWRYRHVQWLRRRAGLTTVPPMAVVRDDRDLKLEIARAADQLHLRRSFVLRPRGASEFVAPLLGMYCCPPLILVVAAYFALTAMQLQEDCNRVNDAVAPRARSHLLGLGELAALALALFIWAGVALALVASALPS